MSPRVSMKSQRKEAFINIKTKVQKDSFLRVYLAVEATLVHNWNAPLYGCFGCTPSRTNPPGNLRAQWLHVKVAKGKDETFYGKRCRSRCNYQLRQTGYVVESFAQYKA